eukprot:GHVQ01015964.1.p1 GENE.GHVQ01015964.1~~GHVQ01015964.1.p1  ORF type:complete len:763 (-),score=87.96 GHVQ01015964.1:264-2552(-)
MCLIKAHNQGCCTKSHLLVHVHHYDEDIWCCTVIVMSSQDHPRYSCSSAFPPLPTSVKYRSSSSSIFNRIPYSTSLSSFFYPQTHPSADLSHLASTVTSSSLPSFAPSLSETSSVSAVVPVSYHSSVPQHELPFPSSHESSDTLCTDISPGSLTCQSLIACNKEPLGLRNQFPQFAVCKNIQDPTDSGSINSSSGTCSQSQSPQSQSPEDGLTSTPPVSLDQSTTCLSDCDSHSSARLHCSGPYTAKNIPHVSPRSHTQENSSSAGAPNAFPILDACIHKCVSPSELDAIKAWDLIYRPILPEDWQELQKLHTEWFPIAYEQSFFDAVCSGEVFSLGAFYRKWSNTRNSQGHESTREEHGIQENVSTFHVNQCLSSIPEDSTATSCPPRRHSVAHHSSPLLSAIPFPSSQIYPSISNSNSIVSSKETWKGGDTQFKDILVAVVTVSQKHITPADAEFVRKHKPSPSLSSWLFSWAWKATRSEGESDACGQIKGRKFNEVPTIGRKEGIESGRLSHDNGGNILREDHETMRRANRGEVSGDKVCGSVEKGRLEGAYSCHNADTEDIRTRTWARNDLDIKGHEYRKGLAYILTIGVADELRRKRIAKELLTQTLRHFSPKSFVERPHNYSSTTNLHHCPSMASSTPTCLSNTLNYSTALTSKQSSSTEPAHGTAGVNVGPTGQFSSAVANTVSSASHDVGVNCVPTDKSLCGTDMTSVYLHVVDYNIPATRLYESLGFRRIQHTNNYYTIMGKDYGAYTYAYYY